MHVVEDEERERERERERESGQRRFSRVGSVRYDCSMQDPTGRGGPPFPGPAQAHSSDPSRPGWAAGPAPQHATPPGYGPAQANQPPPGYGAPQGYAPPPGYGPPPGYPAPQGYGAPPGPGAAQGYGPPPGFGAPAGYGSPAGYGAPPMAFGPPGPVAHVGLFGKVPCPFCGAPLTTHSNAAVIGRVAGGLLGWLLVSAFASKHYCPTHGEIKKAQLPPDHQSALTKKTIAKVAGACGVLVLVLVLVLVQALLA